MSENVDESGLAPAPPASQAQRVEVVGFNMPFSELVGFMIKFAIATIPAAIILVFMAVIAAALWTRMFGGVGAGIG